MTYEVFKRLLYENIMELDTVHEARIGILEKGQEYEEEQEKRVVNAVNLSELGREDSTLQVDVLYAIWDREPPFDCMLYWPVRGYYDRYLLEGWQGVLPELAVAIRRDGGRENALPVEKDTYVQHRANLILRPCSLTQAGGELENCVYWEVGDIALVLYLLLHDKPGNFMSMKLERTITDGWNKKDAVLLTGALLNCVTKMPPRLYQAQTSLRYYNEKGGVFLEGEEGVPIRIDPRDAVQGNVGYRLTTTSRINGAIAIFYPGVRERLAELLHGDFYVVFYSVHEVGIYPVRHKSLTDLKAEIRHHNALLWRKNYLSGKIYRYVELRQELMEA